MQTGKDLLNWLQRQTPEDLNKPVLLDGCDCIEPLDDAKIDGNNLILVRAAGWWVCTKDEAATTRPPS